MSAPLESDPPPRKLGLTKAVFESVNEPNREGDPAVHDPLEMLRQNRAHEKAAGTVYDQSPVPVPRKYRKYLDYLIILAAVDGVLGYMLFFQPQGPFGAVPLIAGLALFSAGWSWVMLVVVDDY